MEFYREVIDVTQPDDPYESKTVGRLFVNFSVWCPDWVAWILYYSHVGRQKWLAKWSR